MNDNLANVLATRSRIVESGRVYLDCDNDTASTMHEWCHTHCQGNTHVGLQKRYIQFELGSDQALFVLKFSNKIKNIIPHNDTRVLQYE